MIRKDIKFYIRELRSDECLPCDGSKKPGHSFCFKCYRSLPSHMQKALYQRMGDGYEEAYDEAVRWLTD